MVGPISNQSIGEMVKDFCPSFIPPFLENIDSEGRNNGSRRLIPVFHNTYCNGRPSAPAVALTLKFLAGVPSTATLSGREKK